MKKIVFITRHNPTSIGGGSYATRAYLEALNKIYPNQVVLFVADSYEDNILSYESPEIIKVPSRNKIIAVLGIFLGKSTRFEKAIKSWLNVNKDMLDTVVFDGSIIGGSFINVFKDFNCRLVTIHHNYEVDFHKENKSTDSVKGYFLYWIKKFEKRAYQLSDINLFLTKSDLNLFKVNYRNNNSMNKIIGCFEIFKKPEVFFRKTRVTDFNANDTIKLIISGSLINYQTEDGVYWFLETMYHELKEKYKNIELTVTGRSPSNDLIKKCKSLKVNLIPSPKNIRTLINAADIYICPTRLGSGLKLRIMDALALGLPSIVHEKSYRGYEKIGESKFITKFSDEFDFLNAFERLLNTIKKSRNYKEHIRNEYLKEFSFNNGVKRLRKHLNTLTETK